jgi:hypothetical protein
MCCDSIERGKSESSSRMSLDVEFPHSVTTACCKLPTLSARHNTELLTCPDRKDVRILLCGMTENLRWSEPVIDDEVEV